VTFQKNSGAVKRFGRLMRFATWLQNLPNKMTPPPFRLMQISTSFWQSRVLYVAARLDIATVLGDEQRRADEIAELVSAQSDATFRLLRMLAAMGIFKEVTPRVFKNNKLSSPLRSDAPDSIRSMILMHNSQEMSRPWFEQLEKGVREGEVPFKLTHGQELFDYMDSHPEFDTLFSGAMDSVEALIGDSFAKDFDWGRFERIIDVGGSRGSKAAAILKRHNGLRALVTDRAQVIEEAKIWWAEHGNPEILQRMDFQAGDLLESIPSANNNGDIYLLSAILHGFDDQTSQRVLSNLATAAKGTTARIALMEFVLPEQDADLSAAAFDMQMFMGTRGRERTLSEWQDLSERSGLLLEEVVDLQSFGKIIVLRPRP
jgi:hypothetical protein